jgi:hypothetical protein
VLAFSTFVKRALVPLPHPPCVNIPAPVSTPNSNLPVPQHVHSTHHLLLALASAKQRESTREKAQSTEHRWSKENQHSTEGGAKEEEGSDLAQVRALEVIAALDAQDMVAEALRSSEVAEHERDSGARLNIVCGRVVVETGKVVVETARVVVVQTKALKLQAVFSMPLLSSHPSAAAPTRTSRTWSRGIKGVEEGCCDA